MNNFVLLYLPLLLLSDIIKLNHLSLYDVCMPCVCVVRRRCSRSTDEIINGAFGHVLIDIDICINYFVIVRDTFFVRNGRKKLRD